MTVFILQIIAMITMPCDHSAYRIMHFRQNSQKKIVDDANVKKSVFNCFFVGNMLYFYY